MWTLHPAHTTNMSSSALHSPQYPGWRNETLLLSGTSPKGPGGRGGAVLACAGRVLPWTCEMKCTHKSRGENRREDRGECDVEKAYAWVGWGRQASPHTQKKEYAPGDPLSPGPSSRRPKEYAGGWPRVEGCSTKAESRHENHEWKAATLWEGGKKGKHAQNQSNETRAGFLRHRRSTLHSPRRRGGASRDLIGTWPGRIRVTLGRRSTRLDGERWS